MIVHRIGAQKALALPEFAPMKTHEQAEMDLLLGRHDQHASLGRRRQDRWGGVPATFLLSDYEKLLALLFAKDAERNRKHTEETRQTAQYMPVPNSAIDEIVAAWNYLMPHRRINFLDGKVIVESGSPGEYHAKEMSDGERVTLYLLGQCLCAPSGAMLVIDEPELHLHRSLMDKLWNKVEALCPDKTFVYLTHDLDFAASRVDAKKIWLRSFNGTAWEWDYVPNEKALPEALVLEILGSRKPLLFCEGERGGLDHTIYQLCYPDMHVVPRGGAEKVVEATKALLANTALHGFAAAGIVDRDVRSQSEVTALEASGIQVLRFAELENLLCAERLIAAVAVHLLRDPATTVSEVTKFVVAALTGEMEAQVSAHAAQRVRYHLSCYSRASADEQGLRDGVTDLLRTLGLDAIIADTRLMFAAALETGRLDEILRLYNRKSIADRISQCFGLAKGEYVPLVIRLLKAADGMAFADLLRNELPRLKEEATPLLEAAGGGGAG
ncbi:MAG: AAA family ATPase [Deltaproteobacteria bacterium]|nr:AAA family ATPase [Deltaproteobacteria bacterium]